MKGVVLAGMIVALLAALVAFAAGLVPVGYAAIGAGGLWLALAGERARPHRWNPAEIEHGRRGRRG